jgi:hypothetical protein
MLAVEKERAEPDACGATNVRSYNFELRRYP